MKENDIIKKQNEAAAYACVSTRTIRRWKNKLAMPMTPEGCYIKSELDRYKSQEIQISDCRTIHTKEIKQSCREIDVAVLVNAERRSGSEGQRLSSGYCISVIQVFLSQNYGIWGKNADRCYTVTSGNATYELL